MIGAEPNNFMVYVLFALLVFVVSVMTHIYYCRKKPKSGLQARAYVLIAIYFIGVYAAGVYCLENSGVLDGHSLWGQPFKITAGVIFVLLVPVYLSFYVLTQLMSPSKKILTCLAQQESLSYADILACVEKENFINTRLNDLCASGCVKEIGGHYTISASGKKIAAVLNFMQYVLGRDIGG